MGKDTKTKELANPFTAFSVLKGEFVPPEPSEDEGTDDVKAGDDTIIEDKLDDVVLPTDDKVLEKGDKALEKIIEKQKQAAIKKTKEPIDDLEDTDSEEDDTKGPSKNENSGIKEFVKSLYDKGISDFDDSDEEFEDSEEGIGKVIDKTLKNRINKWVQSLPEEGVKFLDYIQQGGDPKKFIDTYYSEKSWDDFKIDNEEAQKIVVKEKLKAEGYDTTEIDEMVTEWYDNGTLEKRAKSALPKLQKDEQAQKAQLLEAQKREDARKAQEAQAYWDSFKKELYAKEDIKGFKLTDKVKDKLWNFMTDIDKRTGKTAYEKAIEDNKESSYLFAYLAMNNFDSSKLEKQIETKVSNKFSSMLKNYANTSKGKISSGGTDESFNTSPFEGFKK